MKRIRYDLWVGFAKSGYGRYGKIWYGGDLAYGSGYGKGGNANRGFAYGSGKGLPFGLNKGLRSLYRAAPYGALKGSVRIEDVTHLYGGGDILAEDLGYEVGQKVVHRK